MRTVSTYLVIGLATALGGMFAVAATAQPYAQEQPPAPDNRYGLADAYSEAELPISNEPATIDGCQVLARVNGQVVLACEVLWKVNQMLEENADRIPPEQYAEVREHLMKRQLASSLDTKLLYAEFRRNVPPENLPRIEENLREPFEEREVPRLIEEMGVNSRRELEQELARLGSSLEDSRRSFNEHVIASEWVRTKVKVDEKVTPDELYEYYQAHGADFDYPTQARWEELMVRKERFASPREAYAEMARLGNQAWQAASSAGNPSQPVFSELAKAKSHGYNAKQGGKYDWTTQGALKARAIDRALFSLEIGRMSRILESEDGFHVVRVLERKLAGRKPFTEVQNEIRDKLKDQRFRKAVAEYIDTLRQDARIWTAYTGPVSADVLLGKVPGGTQQR